MRCRPSSGRGGLSNSRRRRPPAVGDGRRGVFVGLADPFDAVGAGIGRAGADGDEAVVGPGDAVEVFAFFAGDLFAPFDAVGGGHAQAVHADADEEAVAVGDVDEGIDGLGVGDVVPLFAVFRHRAAAAVADADEAVVAPSDSADDVLAADGDEVAPFESVFGNDDERRGAADGAGVAADAVEGIVAKAQTADEVLILAVLFGGFPGGGVGGDGNNIFAAEASDTNVAAVSEGDGAVDLAFLAGLLFAPGAAVGGGDADALLAYGDEVAGGIGRRRSHVSR